MHAYIHTCIHTYLPANSDSPDRTDILLRVYSCMHTYIHAYIHTYLPANSDSPDRTDILLRVYSCIHAYIHTYIHTHLPANSDSPDRTDMLLESTPCVAQENDNSMYAWSLEPLYVFMFVVCVYVGIHAFRDCPLYIARK